MSAIKTDFSSTTSPDPHKQRRKEMLAKYPEIKTLMGYERKTKYIALFLVLLQLSLAFYSQHLTLFWWFVSIYFLGATINHSLYTVIHEVTHNLAFKSKLANRWFAVLINLPLGIPAAMTFEKYHNSHHRFLGDVKKDVDIPFPGEAKFFNSRPGKFLWLLLQPLTYSMRPLIKWPQTISKWELLNVIAQVSFDATIFFLFGWKVFTFLILSTLIAMSLHPMAAHLIAEHYIVHKQQETYSYYGPLNYLTFNVGYHVEHHDFPSIPWSKISRLKKIAPEYYDSLYAHKTWPGFMGKFIVSKKINLFSRIIRLQLEAEKTN